VRRAELIKGERLRVTPWREGELKLIRGEGFGGEGRRGGRLTLKVIKHLPLKRALNLAHQRRELRVIDLLLKLTALSVRR